MRPALINTVAAAQSGNGIAGQGVASAACVHRARNGFTRLRNWRGHSSGV